MYILTQNISVSNVEVYFGKSIKVKIARCVALPSFFGID